MFARAPAVVTEHDHNDKQLFLREVLPGCGLDSTETEALLGNSSSYSAILASLSISKAALELKHQNDKLQTFKNELLANAISRASWLTEKKLQDCELFWIK